MEAVPVSVWSAHQQEKIHLSYKQPTSAFDSAFHTKNMALMNQHKIVLLKLSCKIINCC